MARINLLPWREERRKERQKQFLAMLAGFAILSALVVFVVHLTILGMIDDQEARNGYLQKEIATLDKQIKEIQELEKEKARLLARMRVIQDLQANRPVAVHLFDEIVKTLPDGVYYENIARKDRVLTLKGWAESNARISALMRNLDDSGWLTNPQLNIIETKQQAQPENRNFVLQISQKKLPDPMEIAGSEQGDAR